MDTHRSLKPARYAESQVPDYNMSRVGELLPGVVKGVGENGGPGDDQGPRAKDEVRIPPGPAKRGKEKPRKRRYPTNSERGNRALKELSPSAFKIHWIMWRFRGAPGPGKLPFFTVSSLGRFCNLSRNTVCKGLKELVSLGWIVRLGYNPHEKNELYKLVPIGKVKKPAVEPAG